MGRVVFRVDGNRQIGLGHLMRCRALADVLRGRHECHFAVADGEEKVLDELRLAGFGVDHGPGTPDWLTRQVARPGDTLVLDGYPFGEEYRRAVKAAGFRLVCIDDLHQGFFEADVVINHGSPVHYNASPYTKLCLGPEYALLRAPFLDAIAKPRFPRVFDSAFVCFGGSDSQNLTLRALTSLKAFDGLKHVEIVVGAAYGPVTELEAAARGVATVHRNLTAERLVELIGSCGLAITSASTVAYEVCAVGAPLLACAYVDNQRELGAFLAKSGAALLFDDAARLPELNQSLLTRQLPAQQALFKGDVRANLLALFP